MKILLICHAENYHALAFTTLFKRFSGKDDSGDSLYISVPAEFHDLYRYQKRVDSIFVDNPKEDFDICYNVFPSSSGCEILNRCQSDQKIGYAFEDNKIVGTHQAAEKLKNCLLNKQKTNKSLLQIFHNVCKFSWHGQGYNLHYFPRTKTKKNKTGIAVADDSIRKYIKDNLNLQMSEIWHVPLRKNLLKRLDEINRVDRIVTDDLFTAHAGSSLRKHVEFIDLHNNCVPIEFFGRGRSHTVSNI